MNEMIPPLGEGGTQRRDHHYCVIVHQKIQVQNVSVTRRPPLASLHEGASYGCARGLVLAHTV
jgi:hypothetical protein